LNTSFDTPFLDCAYKLQEYAGKAKRKLSEGKATWPARKQVFRQYSEGQIMEADTITLEGDALPGEALLQPVMRGGRRLRPSEPFSRLRDYAAQQLRQLPPHLRSLGSSPPFAVKISRKLESTARKADQSQGFPRVTGT
jgi:nicotinate phosphoribosyltransferase